MGVAMKEISNDAKYECVAQMCTYLEVIYYFVFYSIYQCKGFKCVPSCNLTETYMEECNQGNGRTFTIKYYLQAMLELVSS